VTISRGRTWGELGPLPDDGVVVPDDAAAAAVVARALEDGVEPPPVGLLGGDLCRTLGGRGDEHRLRTGDAARLVVDVLLVRLDDGPVRPAVAHAVAGGRSRWLGRWVAAMNAAWVGEWNVAPRAHPSDGVLDLVDADPSIGDRIEARRRLPLGTHVPHPDIRLTRVKEATLDLGRSKRVWLDGRLAGRARTLTVRVDPDALCVVV
jgi:hypothetical protein